MVTQKCDVFAEANVQNSFLLMSVCLCVGIELDKLDTDMIKLLAWQRIQQLFPPIAPISLPPPAAIAAPKTPPTHPDSKTLIHNLLFKSHSKIVCF